MQLKYIKRGSSCVSLCWVGSEPCQCNFMSFNHQSELQWLCHNGMQRPFWPFRFLFFSAETIMNLEKVENHKRKRKQQHDFHIFSCHCNHPSIHQSSFSYLNQVHEGALEPTPNWLKGWDTHLDRSHLCHRERQTITLAHNYSSFIVSLELLLNLTCMSLDCGREP